MSQIPDWLSWRSSVSPYALALKFGRSGWTYKELQEEVSSLSGHLLSLGVKKRDRVCLLLNSSDVYVMAVHALTRIGAVVVPLNVKQSPPELLQTIGHCDPSLLVYDPELSSLVGSIEERREGERKREGKYSLICSSELKESKSNDSVSGGTIGLSTLHSIVYTSGSTGIPKGVRITASNLFWNAVSFGIRHGGSSADRWLLAMPLYHVGGYTILFRSVLHGSSVILHPGFDASRVVEALDRDGITLVSLVPTMMSRVLEVTSRPVLSLHQIHLPWRRAASIVPRSRDSESKTPGHSHLWDDGDMFSGGHMPYGSLAQPVDAFLRALFPTTFEIRDGGENRSQHLHSNAVGEIVVRGPTIFSGYWRNRGLTRAAFTKGWFHTGDLGT